MPKSMLAKLINYNQLVLVMLCFFLEARMSSREVDVDLAELWANRNCKDCYGRGYQHYQNGFDGTYRKDRPSADYYEYCSCVVKKRKKFGK